jgi:hypothetical protein
VNGQAGSEQKEGATGKRKKICISWAAKDETENRL